MCVNDIPVSFCNRVNFVSGEAVFLQPIEQMYHFWYGSVDLNNAVFHAPMMAKNCDKKINVARRKKP
jgi:hypothetical protein